MFNRIKHFMRIFGHKVESFPTFPDQKIIDLRLELIEEEFNREFKHALEARDMIGVADAIGDILVVVLGAAAAFGIDADAIYAEIHRSNMSKLGADGKPIYRADGKIMKGPNYSPPDIKSVLENQKSLNEYDYDNPIRYEALTELTRPSLLL